MAKQCNEWQLFRILQQTIQIVQIDAQLVQDKHFLITGGGGFIGSNIVKHLLHLGARVRVLDNFLTGNKSNLIPFSDHPKFELIEGDIRDLETCKLACKGIDYISHQAALGSVPRSIEFPDKTNDINVNGFLNILIAAKEEPVKKVVYASSSSVYGDEYSLPKIEEKIGNQLSPYAVSKYTNELYAKVFYKNYGLKILGLRYFNVFGPNQDPNGPYAAVIPLFIDNILKGNPIYINGDGLQTRDFTYVDNAVQANIKALIHTEERSYGEIFNIAYGENYTLLDLVKLLEEFLGKKAHVIHREDRAGDIRNSLANISKAASHFDYNPTHNFKSGIQETVNYFTSK